MISIGTYVQRIKDWIEGTEKSYIRALKICVVMLLVILVGTPASIVVGVICLRMPWAYTVFFVCCYLVPLAVLVVSMVLLVLNVLAPLSLKMKVLRIFTGAWYTVGMAVFLNLIVLAFSINTIHLLSVVTKSKVIGNQMRLPLSRPDGLAIDKDDYLYVGLPTYGRIQKYSMKGEFVRGWFVNTAGAHFDIWIDENSLLHTVIARGGGHVVFDLNGNLVSHDNISEGEKRRLYDVARSFRRKDISCRGWISKVTMRDPLSNEERIILQDPFHLQILQAMQIWIWGGIGVLVLALAHFVKIAFAVRWMALTRGKLEVPGVTKLE